MQGQKNDLVRTKEMREKKWTLVHCNPLMSACRYDKGTPHPHPMMYLWPRKSEEGVATSQLPQDSVGNSKINDYILESESGIEWTPDASDVSWVGEPTDHLVQQFPKQHRSLDSPSCWAVPGRPEDSFSSALNDSETQARGQLLCSILSL